MKAFEVAYYRDSSGNRTGQWVIYDNTQGGEVLTDGDGNTLFFAIKKEADVEAEQLRWEYIHQRFYIGFSPMNEITFPYTRGCEYYIYDRENKTDIRTPEDNTLWFNTESEAFDYIREHLA